MSRIYVFVEGQTEETFVRDVLYEYFLQLELYLVPILVRTGKTEKGGISTYGKIKNQVHCKCSEDRKAYVTTMFDYYALPKDFPGKDSLPNMNNPIEKIIYLEEAFRLDIAQANFIPNLLLHEFEGLLYSNPEAFSNWFDHSVVSQLHRERSQFLTPEHINDGIKTAPSKRILRVCSGYNKVWHGSIIAREIGLHVIRRECPHFDAWLSCLERRNKRRE